MPSPGSYATGIQLEGMERNAHEYGRRNIRQCTALTTTTGCTGTLPEHRSSGLTPKLRVKFDARDDGSPESRIPADLGCACANLCGKCWNHDPADIPTGSRPALPAGLVDRSRSSGGGPCQTLARCQRNSHHELRNARGKH